MDTAIGGCEVVICLVVRLRADHDAVTNGLSLSWNSGTVRGHVNRIKVLKRQMNGRASPDLRKPPS